MDFAENYLCQSCDEVQSAYWNSTMMSLHPIVIYFKDEDGILQHKASFTRQKSSPTIQPQFFLFSRSFYLSCHLWSLR